MNYVRKFFCSFLIFSFLIFSVMNFSACSFFAKNDAAFLKNLKAGLELRWKVSDELDKKKDLNNSEYRDGLRKCVNSELSKLGDYDDYTFEDEELSNLAMQYYNALNSQLDGVQYYGADETKYFELFTQPYYWRAEVLYRLVSDYDFSVSKTYKDTLENMSIEGKAFHEAMTAVEELQGCLADITLERTSTNQYAYSIANASNLDIEYAEIEFKGYNENGASVVTGHSYISNWDAGETIADSLFMDSYFKTATAKIVITYGSTQYASQSVDVCIQDDLIINIDIPELPQSISYSSSYGEKTRCKITDITYEAEYWNDKEATVIISLSGEKTYDQEGKSYSRDCLIGWKLYDETDAVIDSGNCYSGDCSIGEVFKNAEITIHNLAPGSYRLVLLDVK